MEMDRNAFKIQSFKEAADHQKHYNSLEEKEKNVLFLNLMQAAYGFVGNDWPKMDKNHFEERSMIKNEKGDS
jgi:hypothetical protein